MRLQNLLRNISHVLITEILWKHIQGSRSVFETDLLKQLPVIIGSRGYTLTRGPIQCFLQELQSHLERAAQLAVRITNPSTKMQTEESEQVELFANPVLNKTVTEKMIGSTNMK